MQSVQACRAMGLAAMTTAEFFERPADGSAAFDGMLAAHLVEHLPEGDSADVLRPYLAYLAPGAKLVLICPQERGFASDSTHTVFTDNARLKDLAEELGLQVERQYSFPLPRWTGKIFTYNEFVTVASNRATR